MHSETLTNPKIILLITRQLNEIRKKSPEGINVHINEGDILDIQADIQGPEGTPYTGGVFRCKLCIPSDFPKQAPKGYFMTKIFHPNVSEKGEICVNTLKKDWNPARWSIYNILEVIKCLLIAPFPESALNEDAGKLLMENYDAYFKHAKILTEVYAQPKEDIRSKQLYQQAKKEQSSSVSSSINQKIIGQSQNHQQQIQSNNHTTTSNNNFKSINTIHQQQNNNNSNMNNFNNNNINQQQQQPQQQQVSSFNSSTFSPQKENEQKMTEEPFNMVNITNTQQQSGVTFMNKQVIKDGNTNLFSEHNQMHIEQVVNQSNNNYNNTNTNTNNQQQSSLQENSLYNNTNNVNNNNINHQQQTQNSKKLTNFPINFTFTTNFQIPQQQYYNNQPPQQNNYLQNNTFYINPNQNPKQMKKENDRKKWLDRI